MNNLTQTLPLLSEKSYQQSNNRVYVVIVNNNANRLGIKQMIEKQYSVKVDKVNIIKVKGKAKRTITKKGRRVANGLTSDYKKAYVTLAEGNVLPFFNAVEEEEKQAEKVQKEIEKQQIKEEKQQKADKHGLSKLRKLAKESK